MARAESPRGDSGYPWRSRAARTAARQRALAAADAGLAAARAQVRDLEEKLKLQITENDKLRSGLASGADADPRDAELRRRWLDIEPVLRAQLEARDGALASPLTDADILLRNVSEHSARAASSEASCRELRRFQKSERLALPRALVGHQPFVGPPIALRAEATEFFFMKGKLGGSTVQGGTNRWPLSSMPRGALVAERFANAVPCSSPAAPSSRTSVRWGFRRASNLLTLGSFPFLFGVFFLWRC